MTLTLTLTRSMLTFAASLGEDWARALLTNLKDGSLIDMGEAMKYITCPTHPGRIIENHPCEVCEKTEPKQEGATQTPKYSQLSLGEKSNAGKEGSS